MYQIKSTCCGEVIVSGNTLEHALKLAKQDGISLTYADLTNYWLLRVNLSGMDLSGADLTGSCFDRSNFECANLTGAIVDGTSFHGCNFKDVNRTGVTFGTGALAGANTEGMYRDEPRVTTNRAAEAVTRFSEAQYRANARMQRWRDVQAVWVGEATASAQEDLTAWVDPRGVE